MVSTCSLNETPVGGMRVELSSFQNFQTFWETSTQENLAPEASDRPETRLELLTRISSIWFFATFSSRVEWRSFKWVWGILLHVFQTFLGDFNLQQLPFGRLCKAERGNRTALISAQNKTNMPNHRERRASEQSQAMPPKQKGWCRCKTATYKRLNSRE